jgi:hypothetical protein
MARAMVSVVPPGDAPTRSLMGLGGKSSARAGARAPTTVAQIRVAAARTQTVIGRT